MTHTTYTVFAGDDNVTTRSRKQSAIDIAVAQHQASQGAVTFTVRTNVGTEVFRMESVTPKAGRAKPFGRIETPNFEFEPVDGADEVAYVRNRIKTVVLRRNDKTGYVVLDTRTNTRHNADSTKTARQVTNRLQTERKVQVAAQRDAAAAAKAKAKQDREEAKQAVQTAAAEAMEGALQDA